MSITAEKVAEMLALPVEDRAYLAHELIASLDGTADPDVETAWNDVIDRRSREMDEGRVDVRSEEEVLEKFVTNSMRVVRQPDPPQNCMFDA
ncbi:MAG TPA: addiction module protein [Verrucomicrobiae bacterium]|jgi:putative addiction module component (TIGR02574 family)|nr:addiction module protein [Verrucomicrobiae bacterium]